MRTREREGGGGGRGVLFYDVVTSSLRFKAQKKNTAMFLMFSDYDLSVQTDRDR